MCSVFSFWTGVSGVMLFSVLVYCPIVLRAASNDTDIFAGIVVLCIIDEKAAVVLSYTMCRPLLYSVE